MNLAKVVVVELNISKIFKIFRKKKRNHFDLQIESLNRQFRVDKEATEEVLVNLKKATIVLDTIFGDITLEEEFHGRLSLDDEVPVAVYVSPIDSAKAYLTSKTFKLIGMDMLETGDNKFIKADIIKGLKVTEEDFWRSERITIRQAVALTRLGGPQIMTGSQALHEKAREIDGNGKINKR